MGIVGKATGSLQNIFNAPPSIKHEGIKYYGPPKPVDMSTRVQEEPQNGIIRFIVKGREVAHIDSTGLHVRDNIEYGGIARDIRNGSEPTPISKP